MLNLYILFQICLFDNYWKAYAKGSIVGLTRGVNKDHIIRAGLESMAYNTYDIVKCMNNIKELHVDGGVSRNEFLMQFQADILGKKVIKSDSSECTALGTIYMAGLSLGYFKSLNDIKKRIQISKVYLSKMSSKQREELHNGWKNAVKQTIGE